MSGAEIGGLIVFGAMFALVGVLFCLQHRLYARLRSVHPEQYERLGSPTLFLNNSISNGFKTMRFFWSRGYRHLDDPKVTRLCRTIMVINVVYLLLFAGLVAAFVLGAFSSASAA